MLELQKNSFFRPHDVPKIGASNAPYRPPELIFDLFIPDNLRNSVIFQVTMIWSIITQSQIT